VGRFAEFEVPLNLEDLDSAAAILDCEQKIKNLKEKRER
jgi:hypothetical protein